MFDKNQRSKLAENKDALIDVSGNVEVAFDPVKRYNFVVDNYNVDQNRVGIIYYQKMTEYCLFRTMFKVIENKVILMFYVLLLLVPYFGAVLYLLLLIAYIQFLMNLSIFRSNRRKLQDPFTNMILCPKLCLQEKVINKYYEIKINGTQGLFCIIFLELATFEFTEEFQRSLRARDNKGTISFMIYNSRFRDYYNNFPSLKVAFSLTMVFGLIIIVAQGYIIANYM